MFPQASLQETAAPAAAPPLDDEGYRMAMQASLQDRYMQARQRQAPEQEDDPALRAAIAASLAEPQQYGGLYPSISPASEASVPPGYHP